MWSIEKSFHFSAAHWLPYANTACHTVHGHNYRLRVIVTGESLKPSGPWEGMLLSTDRIKEVVDPIIEELDHTTLNTWLPNPTAENLVRHLYDRIALRLVGLYSVVLEETDGFRVEYQGA